LSGIAGAVCLAVPHTCSAQSTKTQAVQIETETFYIPVGWFKDHVDVSLPNGQMLHAEAVGSDAPLKAVLLGITRPPFRPAGATSDLLLPFSIDIRAISQIAASNYAALENEFRAREFKLRTDQGSKRGDVLALGGNTYVVAGTADEFKLSAPLVVRASMRLKDSEFALDRTAVVEFRMAAAVHIRLMFDQRDFPPERWIEVNDNTESLFAFLTNVNRQ
jgi:hypothetical protein